MAWLRTIVYLFIPVDVLLTTPWVASHGDLAHNLYQPLLIGRILPLPTPTPLVVHLVEIGLLLASLVAATNRLPRLAGAVVAVLYLEWMDIAFSYGKVDHDRFAFLVALAVLPTVGRARWKDTRAQRRRRVGAALHPGRGRRDLLPEHVREVALRRGRLAEQRDAGHRDPAQGHAARPPAAARALAAGALAVGHRRDGAQLARHPVRPQQPGPLRPGCCSSSRSTSMTMLTISIIFLPHCVAALAFLPVEALAALPVVLPRSSSAEPNRPGSGDVHGIDPGV